MRSLLNKGSLSMQIHCFSTKCFSSSPHLAPVALPARRETHFWYIVPNEVKDSSLLAQYLDLLSPCEKENIFSMRGEMLQKRALLARALVEWQRDEKWDPPSLHFNLSHTSSLIACGVTVDVPIGIDVEEKERKTKHDISSFARRYFSPQEVEYLNCIPDPEVQRQEFIKLWTLKEAYVKALGRGFSATPFNTFAIQFGGTSKFSLQVPQVSRVKALEIDDGTNITNWKLALFELDSSHYASICVEDKSVEGEDNDALKLKVWKTIPFIQDECASGTDSVVHIGGLE